ncbi:MAG: hypothetical protein GXY47_08860 [Acidobacteria bacterium]|jgi:opacity protein-like surface antigen|nr:hypothetical protein [Acidobacteriota bacterium]
MLRRSLVAAVLIVAGLVCAYAADITGKWNAEFDSQVGPQKYVFDFKVEGTTLTGKAISNIGGMEATTDITEGKIEGNSITFVENLDYQGMPLRIAYKGTVSGDEIKLSRMVGEQEGETFTARRAK